VPAAGGAVATGGVEAAGGQATGGQQTGGQAATGGAAGGVALDCGLPAAGSPGVARPSGTANGLTVLDWAGFEGAVSYTFDDANSSQIEHYSELQSLGVPMTFYLQTGKTEASNAIWGQAVSDGHELGNHTQSHTQTGTGADVDAATTFIENQFGVRPWTMAAPYGDASYQSLAESRFLINRGVSNAIIQPDDSTNPFNLPCYIPATGAPASDFNSQIDSARTAGGWRVVLVHGFAGGTDGAYQPVSIDEFISGVNHAKSFGDLWLDTVQSVGAYWRGQKLVSSVSPTSSGDAQTWSWTLPANFPPDTCLRVQVEGGTLTQEGQALAWDGHGYYEIALDAGSVTLTP
jgi:peptidoglycan/xylan/chitin deacetylase (PgdA/CDA1 family)